MRKACVSRKAYEIASVTHNKTHNPTHKPTGEKKSMDPTIDKAFVKQFEAKCILPTNGREANYALCSQQDPK